MTKNFSKTKKKKRNIEGNMRHIVKRLSVSIIHQVRKLYGNCSLTKHTTIVNDLLTYYGVLKKFESYEIFVSRSDACLTCGNRLYRHAVNECVKTCNVICNTHTFQNSPLLRMVLTQLEHIYTLDYQK